MLQVTKSLKNGNIPVVSQKRCLLNPTVLQSSNMKIHSRPTSHKNHSSIILFILSACAYECLLSAAERRGTPVLLSASVSANFGNSPQMAAPRRSREIDQSTQRFHVGWFHVGWQRIWT